VRNEVAQKAFVGEQVGHVRRRTIALSLALGLGGVIVGLLPLTVALEEALGLGVLFAARGPLAAPQHVEVVGISRDAAIAVGQTAEIDTWPRSLHARAIDNFVAGGASTIAFDLMFYEPRSAEDDELLAVAIERAGNVLLVEGTRDERVQLSVDLEGRKEIRLPPLEQFKAGALGSAPFVLPTVPIRVARFWTFGRATPDAPSLPALAVQAHLLPYYDEFTALVESARVGATESWPASRAAVTEQRSLELTVRAIRRTFLSDMGLAKAARARLADRAVSEQSRRALEVLLDMYAGPSSRYLNLYGPARAVATLPFDRVVGSPGALDVAGKILFVGASEPRQSEQQDDFYSVFSEHTGINLSGVEIGATAIANLLEQRTLVPLPMLGHLGLLLALGVAIGAGFARLTTKHAAMLAIACVAAYFGVAYWLFVARQVWLPLVVPVLLQIPAGFAAVLWWNYRELGLQRERVKTALGYYVPLSVAHRLAEQTVSMSSSRQLLHGTCLFTDAEQYTAVAEGLRPDSLAALMNDYYRALFRVVEEHGGEVSDTAGDSMVAVWASAEPDPEARSRAMRAAIAILGAVDDFNNEQKVGRLPTRVGLESGELALGNIGAEQRYEYRAIGDIVNTAARIQGLNSILGTRVLISAATRDGAQAVPARDLGTFILRGKRLPVTVWEPLAAAATSLDAEALAEFAAALAAFRSAGWEEAHTRFVALTARCPDDGPSRYYAALVSGYRQNPPHDWAGVVRLTTK
jgi:adenylate cyclase